MINLERKRKGIKFIYYSPPIGEKSIDLNLIYNLGLNYIDSKIKFIKSLHTLTGNADPLVSLVSNNDNEINKKILKDLALDLAKYSRFYRDKDLNKDKTKELYSAWIDNSLQGTIADFIYIIGSKKNPFGFVTYKGKGENISLELINISLNYRGKGHGKRLLNSSLADLAKRGIKKCSVATYLSNRNAINLYTSMGFKMYEANHIFHGHFDGEE